MSEIQTAHWDWAACGLNSHVHWLIITLRGVQLIAYEYHWSRLAMAIDEYLQEYYLFIYLFIYWHL